MYVCGMTVYDSATSATPRSMIAFDVVQRWLQGQRLSTSTYVRNITDIDDKIIRRAVENGETHPRADRPHDRRDARGRRRARHRAAHARAARHRVRAADAVDDRRTLEGKGLAYRVANGDVNYAVRKFPGYGKLSGKSLDELHAGERVAVLDGKDDPLDFVLWKSAKPDEPARRASGTATYGRGRPGWHIECSAMACALLGETFDIHGGGADLQFPHHENEIAQSEGANGKPLARYWMHNGFVNIDDEKMSKSLGNFFTDPRGAEEVRRRDRALLRGARALPQPAQLQRRAPRRRARLAQAPVHRAATLVPPAPVAIDWAEPHAARFKAAMDNDFGTPEAVAVLFELAAEVNRDASRPQLAGLLQGAGRLPRPAAGRPASLPARRHARWTKPPSRR